MEENKIVLLTIEDIEKITGWSPRTINKVMASPDFPVLKIGKKNQVLLESFKKYLEPRRELRGEE